MLQQFTSSLINLATGALASIGPPVPTGEEGTDSVAVHPSGKFAYVASSGNVFDIDNGTVAMYTINATTGALASIEGGISGENPNICCFNSVTVDPSGKFAYVPNGGGGSTIISMYTINGTTGVLMPIGSIAAGTSPTSIAVHPSGKFAYVTNSMSNDVSIYSIDGATGALTLIGTTGT